MLWRDDMFFCTNQRPRLRHERLSAGSFLVPSSSRMDQYQKQGLNNDLYFDHQVLYPLR